MSTVKLKTSNIDIPLYDFPSRFAAMDVLANQCWLLSEAVEKIENKLDQDLHVLRTWPAKRESIRNHVILALAGRNRAYAADLAAQIHKGDAKAQDIKQAITEFVSGKYVDLQAEQNRLSEQAEPLLDPAKNCYWRFFEKEMKATADKLLGTRRVFTRLNTISAKCQEAQSWNR